MTSTVLDELEYVKCILCGRDDAGVFVAGPGRRQIVRCNEDALIYVNPRATNPVSRRAFASYVRQDNLHVFSSFRRRMLRREASAIQSLKGGGNLLDVGCASGTFFENFMGAGWRRFGVELGPFAARLASEHYQADVFCGTLREAGLAAATFDVVTVLDALFYFPDPLADLMEIKRVLKDDGLLAVEIPGLRYRLCRDQGPLCWMLDRRWRRMHPDAGHLYYFSPRTLNLLLEKAGFRVLRMVPEQASMTMGKLALAFNNVHFAIAKTLFGLTGFSIAAKELYLAVKADCAKT